MATLTNLTALGPSVEGVAVEVSWSCGLGRPGGMISAMSRGGDDSVLPGVFGATC